MTNKTSVYISSLPSEGNTIGSPVNQSIKHLFFFNAIISIDGSFNQSIMHLLSSMLPSQLTFLSPSEHGENWWFVFQLLASDRKFFVWLSVCSNSLIRAIKLQASLFNAVIISTGVSLSPSDHGEVGGSSLPTSSVICRFVIFLGSCSRSEQ